MSNTWGCGEGGKGQVPGHIRGAVLGIEKWYNRIASCCSIVRGRHIVNMGTWLEQYN